MHFKLQKHVGEAASIFGIRKAGDSLPAEDMVACPSFLVFSQDKYELPVRVPHVSVAVYLQNRSQFVQPSCRRRNARKDLHGRLY